MEKESLTLLVYVLETNDKAYEYGIPISQVHEITRPGNMIKLPGMPDFINGIMNLRGEVIPILDFKKRFNLGATGIKDTTRIVVVNMNNQKCGVIVDDVLEIVQISAENIEDAPSITDGVKSNFILGIGTVNDRLITAIDIIKILTESEQAKIATCA
ncbi:Chemotaxis protein CheW [Sporomusa silvacetica DSM 10669]|uniref:Chemotaxis protein CheW n=1 Tax=Sporomusa silvacetica DSM 10669 TaxID=1123289 RepID=A0ABZ3IVE8_9FIRM|nr:chemotaxis protein CheW [Sporomusa silvacetica]OZC12978.1 chemotaxis protein CheW [Sporomusa silvacetica DSM 10669]